MCVCVCVCVVVWWYGGMVLDIPSFAHGCRMAMMRFGLISSFQSTSDPSPHSSLFHFTLDSTLHHDTPLYTPTALLYPPTTPLYTPNVLQNGGSKHKKYKNAAKKQSLKLTT